MSNALAWVNATSSDVLTGLVNRWKMDEGSGTTTADDIGGKTATFAGTPNPSWITGPSGNGALQGSGTAQMSAGTAADWSFMENTGIWTFNCWFQFTDFTLALTRQVWATQDGAHKGVLIGFQKPATTTRINVIVRTAAGVVASFLDGAISDNNWHMLTVLSNGTQIKVYTDASANGTPVSLTGTGTGDSSQQAYFFSHGGSGYFAGGLDDLRIYNVALSTGDLTTLFTNGAK